MVYTPQTWVNDSTTTPLTAARLTYMETGIAAAAGPVASAGPVAASLSSPWSNYGSGFAPLRFFRDTLGRVYLEGFITTSSAIASGVDSTLFTISTGYRPTAGSVAFSQFTNSAGAVARLTVTTAGLVQIRGAITAGAYVAVSASWSTL